MSTPEYAGLARHAAVAAAAPRPGSRVKLRAWWRRPELGAAAALAVVLQLSLRARPAAAAVGGARAMVAAAASARTRPSGAANDA